MRVFENLFLSAQGIASAILYIFFLLIIIYIYYYIVKKFIENDIKNNKIPDFENMINSLYLKIDNLEKKIDKLQAELKKED